MLREKEPGYCSIKVLTDSGRFDLERMEKLLHVAKEYGNGEVTYTRDCSVLLRKIPESKVSMAQKALEKEGLVFDRAGARVQPVVNCQDDLCPHTSCRIEELAEKFQILFCRRMQEVELPSPLTIAMDGCSKGCALSVFHDMGVQEW